jgi:chromosome segregation ATPase
MAAESRRRTAGRAGREEEEQGGGDGEEDEAALARIAAAETGLVSAAAAAKAVRTAVADLHEVYAAAARGPARDRCLGEYCVTRMPALAGDAAGRADDAAAALAAALRARGQGLLASVASARGKGKAAAEIAAQDRRSADAALAEASRQAGETAERLRSTIAAQESELSRAGDKFERLVAAFESSDVRGEEARSQLAADLSSTRARLDAVQGERLALALDAATAGARLAEAQEALLRAERGAAAAVAAVATSDARGALLLERMRGAENETVRLREETELLYESNKVSKDLLATKATVVEELEYQLGQAKARLAQAYSDRSELEAEGMLLEGLATKAKAALAKAKALKSLPSLDKAEQRRWDGLPTAPV